MDASEWDFDDAVASAVSRQRQHAREAKARVATALDNLGRQLAIAAGLTRAFIQGYSEGYIDAADNHGGEATDDDVRDYMNGVGKFADSWRPGCGREAP